MAALAPLLFALLTSSGCIGLTNAGKPGAGQQGTPAGATISLAPASINFGQVPVGSTASQSVTITNGGGSNLTITQASTTAAGVSIAGISLPFVIPAGKQARLDVAYSPKAAGTLSGNVSVMSDVSGSPSAVSLSGTAMAATALLTANVSSLNFGNVTVGKSGTLSVTLTNAGNSDVTVSNVNIAGAPYSQSGVSVGLILSPGQSAILAATFAPQSAGNQPGIVTVSSNATNSPTRISLLGDGAPGASQPVPHSVTLTWSPSVSVVAGYLVYRSEVSGGPYTQLDPNLVTADTYVDPTVQAGLTYYYVVASVTSTGAQSANSAQVSATIPTP